MTVPLLELEGTAEEIQEQLAAFSGQRLHVTIQALDSTANEMIPQQSISQRLLAIAEEMPAIERAQMPPDLAEQHDHYIYGWPKK